MENNAYQEGFDDLDNLDDDYGYKGDTEVIPTYAPDVESSFDDMDSLDDLDGDFDGGEQVSSAIDINAQRLSQFSAEVSTDMEDLLSDFGDADIPNDNASIGTASSDGFNDTVTALSTESDTDLINQHRAACQELGFALSAEATLQQAEDLHTYAHQAETEIQEHDKMLAGLVDMYDKSLISIVGSSSMQVKHDTNESQFKARLLNGVHDSEDRNVYGKSISATWEAISLQEKRGVPLSEIVVNPRDIFKSLLLSAQNSFGGLNAMYLTLHQERIENYINTAATAIINNKVTTVNSARDAGQRRYFISKALLKKFRNAVRMYDSPSHAIVKQIETFDNGNIIWTCPKCGAKVKADALMNFIFYIQDKAIKRIAFPEMTKCSCGTVMSLPVGICFRSLEHFAKEYEKDIRAGLSHAANFGKGIAIISYTPTLAQLPSCATCIVTDTATATSRKADSVISESFAEEDEWLRAVDDFYKHLDVLNFSMGASRVAGDSINIDNAYEPDELNDDANVTHVVQYQIDDVVHSNVNPGALRLLAANVAQIAGVNYNTTKGKALISLIAYLNNNIYTQKTLRFDDVITVNLAVKLAERYTASADAIDLNAMSHEFFAKLMSVAGLLNPALSCESDRNAVVDYLKSHLEELRALAKKYSEEYANLWDTLEISKYALAYVPILDLKQTSVYSIVQLITSNQKFALIDEICDRMIIATYADKYYEYWLRMRLGHSATLNTRLNSSADIKGIRKIMTDTVVDNYSEFGVQMTSRYFSNVAVQGTTKWKVLANLRESVNSGNYHQFCCEAMKLRAQEFGFGAMFDSAMSKFIQENYSEFYNTAARSEAEYYLLGMFTPEELEAAKEELQYLTFSRYVPRRKGNESITEYAERLKHADALDSIDNLTRFSKIKNLGLILFGAAIMDAEFDNFRISNFVIGLLDAALSASSSGVYERLGISVTRQQMLQSLATEWRFSDFNLCNEDVVTVLNAFYFTDIEDVMLQMFSDMSDTYFVAEATLTPLDATFDFPAHLSAKLDAVAANPDASDKQSMVEEMRIWEYTKGYTERFAGE